MQFHPPLVAGTLVRRYKRFLADVNMADGVTITAHCVNPGAMRDIAQPGNRVWLSPIDNAKAKLKWRWQIEEHEGGLIGVNTMLANALAEEAMRKGGIEALAGAGTIRREQPWGDGSRIDFLLTGEQPCLVEVKNVHWRRGDAACFPDSVTKRGAKHLNLLAQAARQGHRAVILFIVQRSDCSYLCPARDIDPGYGQALDAALNSGVEALAYDCQVTPDGIAVARQLPVKV